MADDVEQIEGKLAAYIDGELSAAECAEIEAHLAEHPGHRELIHELMQQRQVLQRMPREKAPDDLADEVQGQLEREALLGGDLAADPDRVLHINRWPQILSAAAILVLAVGLGVVMYSVLPPRHPSFSLVPAPLPEQSPAAEDGAIDEPADESVAENDLADKDAVAGLKSSPEAGPAAEAASKMGASSARPETPALMELAKARGDEPVVITVDAENFHAASEQVLAYLAANHIQFSAADGSAAGRRAVDVLAKQDADRGQGALREREELIRGALARVEQNQVASAAPSPPGRGTRMRMAAKIENSKAGIAGVAEAAPVGPLNGLVAEGTAAQKGQDSGGPARNVKAGQEQKGKAAELAAESGTGVPAAPVPSALAGRAALPTTQPSAMALGVSGQTQDGVASAENRRGSRNMEAQRTDEPSSRVTAANEPVVGGRFGGYGSGFGGRGSAGASYGGGGFRGGVGGGAAPEAQSKTEVDKYAQEKLGTSTMLWRDAAPETQVIVLPSVNQRQINDLVNALNKPEVGQQAGVQIATANAAVDARRLLLEQRQMPTTRPDESVASARRADRAFAFNSMKQRESEAAPSTRPTGPATQPAVEIGKAIQAAPPTTAPADQVVQARGAEDERVVACVIVVQNSPQAAPGDATPNSPPPVAATPATQPAAQIRLSAPPTTQP